LSEQVVGASNWRGQAIPDVTSATLSPKQKPRDGLKNIVGLPSKLRSQTTAREEQSMENNDRFIDSLDEPRIIVPQRIVNVVA
jgi:hypothetical protein